MRLVIQRVSEASVQIGGAVHAAIGKGLLILIGIHESDTEADAIWLAGKVARLRIFSDAEGKMNQSLADIGGAVLVVSQFTLYAQYEKGNRPSFIEAARPEKAIPLYEFFKAQLEAALSQPVHSGIFGADMQVALLNDGPVTIVMEHPKQYAAHGH
ncbi:MAG: D-tyrosyl-tRNA(Tyr) deacylase [Sphingobacteriales bacterium]|nr:MAG: D-tyrosyl-tRNA(Tyr) deacylase [Sphingobacteriales bacterium]